MPVPRLHRRDFLRPRAKPPRGALDPTAHPGSPEGCDYLKATRPAMGSAFEVRLPVTTPGALGRAEAALDRIDELEAQLTIYRSDSELSRLNSTAHLRPIEVSPNLFALLWLADELSREVEGAYDVATGSLSNAWGFIKGPRRVPDDETLAAARASSGREHVRLDPERCTVAFDRAGIILNLGSIGKGYAIDEALGVLKRGGRGVSALIHGGQSSVAALGRRPGERDGRTSVALRDPRGGPEPLGTIRFKNRALGTSGSAFQQFEINGRTYGHIIDPRTGAPCVPWAASLTVLAPTAALADAVSTALFVAGRDAAVHLLRRRRELGLIAVLNSQRETPASVWTVNLHPGEFIPAGGVAVDAEPIAATD